MSANFFPLLLAALTSWGVPAPTADTYARAMAAVCASERECVRLASYAFVESAHFAPWVLDESCNSKEWRDGRRGWERRACDGGLAYGPWQVHDEAMRGASPEFQASYALVLLRRDRTLWSTWRAAESHAAWWMGRIGNPPKE